jgi:hypothetical protein
VSPTSRLDDIRRVALDSAETSKRLWTRVIALFAVLEGSCWIGFVLLAYFEFPTSVLIGVAALLVYSTIFASIMGLRCHVDNCTQRILKALESLATNPATGRE